MPTSFTKATKHGYAHLDAQGSYHKIGFEIGKAFKSNIAKIIERRKDWHSGLIGIIKSDVGSKYSRALLEYSNKYFPDVITELKGMADGSGYHFDYLWAMSIKSELGLLLKEPPGCSTIAYCGEKKKLLLHNEDGHKDYRDILYTVRATPPSGISYMSLFYTASIAGGGPALNSKGIGFTTNYIGTTKPQVGVPRYVIGRAVLEATKLQEAVDIVTTRERAFPFHFNLFSFNEQKYASLETTPFAFDLRYLQGYSFHTNHLLSDKLKGFEFAEKQTADGSSMSRYSVIKKELGKLNDDSVNDESLLAILSSHQKRPFSPCRHAQGHIFGQTLATALVDITEGRFLLYKGNPCESLKEGLPISFEF